jgi:hypothetical protein
MKLIAGREAGRKLLPALLAFMRLPVPIQSLHAAQTVDMERNEAHTQVHQWEAQPPTRLVRYVRRTDAKLCLIYSATQHVFNHAFRLHGCQLCQLRSLAPGKWAGLNHDERAVGMN